jgi:hypothetical protein
MTLIRNSATTQTRIIRSHPSSLHGHESRSTSGCAGMSLRGDFAVVVGTGTGGRAAYVTMHPRHCRAIDSEIHRGINDGGY